jgi:hypothetical protein
MLYSNSSITGSQTHTHALGHGKDKNDFNKDDSSKMTASIPKSANPSALPKIIVKYYLHCNGQGASVLGSSSVLSWESVCPPFESCPNQNLFQQFFGIESCHKDHIYVRAKSNYEFARCFGLVDNIQHRMSHKQYTFGLNATMPGCTSSWQFKHIHSHLLYLRNANSEIFLPNQFAVSKMLHSLQLSNELPVVDSTK